MRVNGSQNNKIYILSHYHLWKVKDKICVLEDRCTQGQVFKLGQLLYSKTRNAKTKHYHAECAVLVGILTKEDFFKYRKTLTELKESVKNSRKK
jgi:hypothetical protein